MPKLKTGISQVGGKFRLCNTILQYVPYHEFFLSLFCGACWVEINKPRCRYECFNDLDAEIINYLLMVREYPDEFDALKQGVFGLVSQEVCNRIVRGEIKPKDNLERAYLFYYLNKLTFGGDVKKIGGGKEDDNVSYSLQPSGHQVRQTDAEKGKAHYCGIMRPTDPCRQPQVEKIKQEYKTKGFAGIINARAIPQNTLHKEDSDKIKEEWKTKGYIGLIDTGSMPQEGYGRVDSKVVERAKKEYAEKCNYKGISYHNPHDVIEKKVKPSFRGISSKVEFDAKEIKAHYGGITTGGKTSLKEGEIENSKASYKGIANHGVTGWGTLESDQVEKAKKQYKAVSFKGINPKTTRPYQNNDCGLLTPLDRDAIDRLRYVNITCYPFDKVYKLFFEAFHERKGLSRECFIYADPPYPGTEKYYGDKFPKENHMILIDLMKKTPFNFMLSIGGECDFYLEELKDWVIVPVKVRYSTDARSQKKSQEYIIMNYEIRELGNMTNDFQKEITSFF